MSDFNANYNGDMNRSKDLVLATQIKPHRLWVEFLPYRLQNHKGMGKNFRRRKGIFHLKVGALSLFVHRKKKL